MRPDRKTSLPHGKSADIDQTLKRFILYNFPNRAEGFLFARKARRTVIPHMRRFSANLPYFRVGIGNPYADRLPLTLAPRNAAFTAEIRSPMLLVRVFGAMQVTTHMTAVRDMKKGRQDHALILGLVRPDRKTSLPHGKSADIDQTLKRFILYNFSKPSRRVADCVLSNARTRERTKAYVTAVRDMKKGRKMRPYPRFGAVDRS